MIRSEFPGRSLSGIGGVETGSDAAQFILLGANTVQVCTGVMKFGHELVKPLCEALLAFMEKHKFETLDDFRGHSLDYFTSHAELVAPSRRPQSRRRKPPRPRPWHCRPTVTGASEKFVEQSAALESINTRASSVLPRAPRPKQLVPVAEPLCSSACRRRSGINRLDNARCVEPERQIADRILPMANRLIEN